MTAPHEDILLDKLQQTIHLWSDEVTQAHSGLTQQISDTRTQLNTLIHTIADRNITKKSPNGEIAAVESTPSPLEFERNKIALSETIAHNKLLLQDLDALKSNYHILEQKHKHTISINQKLASSLKTLKTREHKISTERDAANRELERLEATKDLRTENHQHVQSEMKHLVETANQAIALQEDLLRERDGLADKNNELVAQCEDAALILNQHSLLKNQLAELQVEVTEQNDAMIAAQSQISALESDRARLSEELYKSQDQINHLQDHAELAAAENIQSLKADLKEKDSALIQMQSQLSTLVETQNPHQDIKAENDKLKNQLSHLKQIELDLKSELASLGQEYERQADVLREAVKEVEAHWKIESKAKDTEQRLKVDIDTLNDQLKEKNDQLLQVEQEIIELRAIETPAPPIPVTASGKTERDLEEFHLDLITLENFLNEREKNIGLAADKMKSLEVTALAVQAEVSALQKEHQKRINQPDTLAADTLQKAEEEIALLKNSLEQQTRISDTQQEVINGQAQAIDRYKAEFTKQQSTQQEQAVSPDKLTEALHEIESLKNSLKQRETELSEARTAPSRIAAPYAFTAFDDNGKQRSMGEILVNAGIINTVQLTSALEEQQTSSQRRLGSILVEQGHIREEIVAQVVASQLKLPFIRIEEENTNTLAIHLLNAQLATQHMAFPIQIKNEYIIIAMANPLDLIAIEDLEFATQKIVSPAVATHTDIAHAIVSHYGVSIPANAPKPKPKSITPRKATPSNESS